MILTVADIIKTAGGPEEISRESRSTTYPVSPDAVHKWRVNGIPEVHWPIFFRRASVDAETLFRANERLRSLKRCRSSSDCAA